ncbi:MAG: YitT family protein [Tissierellia bacterium]|nr:YitT family protein [Tissierellia bacterium]
MNQLKTLSSLDTQRKEFLSKLIHTSLGCLFSALALSLFLKPNGMISGGINGISIILDQVTSFSLARLILFLNLPLLLLGFIFLKKSFMVFSTLSVFLLSSFVSLIYSLLPPDFSITQNILLAAVFGGVLNGTGLGLCFRAGTSTGGLDIVASILRQKYNFKIGSILQAFNFFIVLVSSFIFSIDQALFTLISMALTYSVLDRISLGVGRQKQVFIISSKYDDLAEEIQYRLDRGVTFFQGQGAWTRQDLRIIYCIVSSRQLVYIRKYVNQIDPHAFMAVSDTAEIQGRGFKKLEI